MLKKETIKRYVRKEDCFFAFISIVFAVIMYCINIGSDDAVVSVTSGNGIREWIKFSVDSYYTWTSRIIVNFVWYVLLHCSKWVWSLYMMISIFVFLKALSLLYSKSQSKELSLYIACIVLLFPYITLTTAGWIATSVTYYGPLAFGLMSLVPIRKLQYNKIGIFEFLFYCCCLIYAANEEQMMVVILFAYITALIYYIVNHKVNWMLVVLSLLSIASAVFVITCPGNGSRKVQEIRNWFPTFNMLDVVDKSDIGLSSTLRWIFFDSNNISVIWICVLLTVLVWSRYNDIMFRVIALIPAGIVVLLGPARAITITAFPYLEQLSSDVPGMGTFTVENKGRDITVIQFSIMLFIVVCICAMVILLNNTLEGIIADLVILSSGLASRVVMGFSPTVYASNTRTFTILIVCIIAVSVHLLSENIVIIRKNDRVCSFLIYSSIIGMIFGMTNLLYLVLTTVY